MPDGQRQRTVPASQVEHSVAAAQSKGSRQKQGVQREAIAPDALSDLDGALEQGVFGLLGRADAAMIWLRSMVYLRQAPLIIA